MLEADAALVISDLAMDDAMSEPKQRDSCSSLASNSQPRYTRLFFDAMKEAHSPTLGQDPPALPRKNPLALCCRRHWLPYVQVASMMTNDA